MPDYDSVYCLVAMSGQCLIFDPFILSSPDMAAPRVNGYEQLIIKINVATQDKQCDMEWIILIIDLPELK